MTCLMNLPLVYTLGAISGCDEEAAMGWRHQVRIALWERFRVLIPIETTPETIIDKRYRYHLDGVEGGVTDSLVVAKDRYWVEKSDFIFANLLYDAGHPSWGSGIELGWADSQGKVIIMALQEGSVHYHSFSKRLNNLVIVPTVETGIDVIKRFAVV